MKSVQEEGEGKQEEKEANASHPYAHHGVSTEDSPTPLLNLTHSSGRRALHSQYLGRSFDTAVDRNEKSTLAFEFQDML